MKTKLHTIYTREELEKLYSGGYDCASVFTHQYRFKLSQAILRQYIDYKGGELFADFGFGDATLSKWLLQTYSKLKHGYLFDISKENIKQAKDSLWCYPGKVTFFHGLIEENLEKMPKVDWGILSEVLEHIEEPEKLVRKLKEKVKYLFITTPLDEAGQSAISPDEHYWSWTDKDIREIMEEAGWLPITYVPFHIMGPRYLVKFQMWLFTSIKRKV